jgi:hypothetical protein
VKEIPTYNLFLELKKVSKEKGVRPSRELGKAMKTQTPDPFTRKDTMAKRVRLSKAGTL